MDDQAEAVTTLTPPRREEVEAIDEVEPPDDGAVSLEDELRAAIVRKLWRRA